MILYLVVCSLICALSIFTHWFEGSDLTVSTLGAFAIGAIIPIANIAIAIAAVVVIILTFNRRYLGIPDGVLLRGKR